MNMLEFNLFAMAHWIKAKKPSHKKIAERLLAQAGLAHDYNPGVMADGRSIEDHEDQKAEHERWHRRFDRLPKPEGTNDPVDPQGI